MCELILVSAYIDALPPTLAVMLSNIKTAINLATSYDKNRNFVLSNVDHLGAVMTARADMDPCIIIMPGHILPHHSFRGRIPGWISHMVILENRTSILIHQSIGVITRLPNTADRLR